MPRKKDLIVDPINPLPYWHDDYRTPCCGAYYTIGTDSGEPCCKACWGELSYDDGGIVLEVLY